MTINHCPKCSGEVQFMPAGKPPQALSWIGGELAGWVVAAVVLGAVSCAFTERYALASILGVVAAIGVFALLEAHRDSPSGAGVYHCPKCQYYYRPERFKGDAGAI